MKRLQPVERVLCDLDDPVADDRYYNVQRVWYVLCVNGQVPL